MECIEVVKQPVELNARQKKALTALLSSKTVKEASKLSGVRLGTLFKWQKDPIFRDELERLRTEILNDTVAKLKFYSSESVQVLANLMQTSKNESIKHKSAMGILENCRAFVTLRDLETRLANIENAIINPNKENGGTYVYKANS